MQELDKRLIRQIARENNLPTNLVETIIYEHWRGVSYLLRDPENIPMKLMHFIKFDLSYHNLKKELQKNESEQNKLLFERSRSKRQARIEDDDE